MSATAQDLLPRYRLTAAEFQRMGAAGVLAPELRVELIEGDIIQMPPIGSWHAGLVSRLNRRLQQAVGEQAIVSVQNPLDLGRYSEPRPDLVLLRPRDDFYTTTHPTAADALLIVEVADSTLRYDREVKLPLYARFGIPKFWLVEVGQGRLWVFSTPGRDGYGEALELREPGRRAPLALPACPVDLEGLFE